MGEEIGASRLCCTASRWQSQNWNPSSFLHRIWLGRQEVRAGKDFGGASVPGSVAAGRFVTQWTPSFHQAIHHRDLWAEVTAEGVPPSSYSPAATW